MSVEKEDKFGIVQFHGENFSTWKFRVEVIIQEYGISECLTKDPPADEAARKNVDQQVSKAKSIIIRCVADSHLEYVREGTTAKEKWFKLISAFERQGVSNRLLFLKQLLTMKYNEEESIDSHIVKFGDTVRKRVRSCKAPGLIYEIRSE
ncbi:hypothetical protein JTB14_019283 [Gonioctena quinquepunctata]|nr:hypothetical protein JTB14_019283 [Gonioctena quinquepunctata]